MQTYILFSLLAALCFAGGGLLNKLTGKHLINNKNSLMALFLLFCFIFGLLLFPFINHQFLTSQAFLPMTLMTITFFIGYYLFYSGMLQTDISSFAPLFQLQSGMIAILAFIFLGERFPLSNYLYISLLILGAILVSIDESFKLKAFFKPGILFILLMQFFHALSNLYVGISLKFIGPLEILFWQYLGLGILFIPFYFLTKPKLNYPVKSLASMFLAISSSGIGAIFLFKAFQTNLTISSTIAMLSTPIIFIFSVLSSRFFPQLLEHHSAKVYLLRTIGLIVILFGALKLAI